MEKSWNEKNWQKVVEFCDQSWNFTNFAPEFYQICFADNKKLSVCLESLHFLTFSAKCRKCGLLAEKRSWKSYGKFVEKFCKICRDPVLCNIDQYCTFDFLLLNDFI